MRNITIKRNKKLAACLMKVSLYIEDRESPETMVKGVPCRLLGKLKNGKELTFTLNDEPARIIALVGASQNLEWDSYLIPDGEDDIVITGQNIYKPMSGNPFMFNKSLA